MRRQSEGGDRARKTAALAELSARRQAAHDRRQSGGVPRQGTEQEFTRPRQAILDSSSDEEDLDSESESFASALSSTPGSAATPLARGDGEASCGGGGDASSDGHDKASSTGVATLAEAALETPEDALAEAVEGLGLDDATIDASANAPSSVSAESEQPATAWGVENMTEPGLELAASSSAPPALVLNDLFRLSRSLSQLLYPHQTQGVAWLWSLYRLSRGGILADDMGLGKTLQCAAFLAGVLLNGLGRRALVVAPKTLLAQWARELERCGLGGRVETYFSGAAGERERALRRVVGEKGAETRARDAETGEERREVGWSGTGVLLTTYGMVQHNSEALAGGDATGGAPTPPLWDAIFLDEGHKIKNPRMKLRGHLDAIPARSRVVISGTPIQNDLQELWALLDYAQPGLLGDAKTFARTFADAIVAGCDRRASEREREASAAASRELQRVTAPYILRREKKEVMGSGRAGGKEDSGASPGDPTPESLKSNPPPSQPSALPRKNDLIVWLQLHSEQRRLYEAFLHSPPVREALNETRSALAAVTVLKKICDHPALLSVKAQQAVIAGARAASKGQSGCESDASDAGSLDEEEEEAGVEESPRPSEDSSTRDPSADPLLQSLLSTSLEASCKTLFVMRLLALLVRGGHRTAVFSHSRVMLDILAAALRSRGWRHLRLDGSVASPAERAARVETFQKDAGIPVFLLTSQVGGLGLTLTAADRVIIVDPAWNPSVDNQSVDRAYRIGQTKDVVVYRLISCGTVEDKMYRKQIFKGGLSRQGMSDPSASSAEQYRYFSLGDLRDLFRVVPSELERSPTQAKLEELHGAQRSATPELQKHLEEVANLPGFAGLSDHDLLYTKPDDSVAGPGAAEPERWSKFAGDGRTKTPKKGKGAPPREWIGAGDIADLFASRLNLGGSKPPSLSLSPGAQQRRLLRELQNKLEAQLNMLAKPGLVAALPDRGAKIQAGANELRRQIAQVEAELDGRAAGEGKSDSGASPHEDQAGSGAAGNDWQGLKKELKTAALQLANRALVDALPDAGASLWASTKKLAEQYQVAKTRRNA